MGEMPVKTDFDADKGEDVHNGTGDYFGYARAVAPGEASGGQNAEKWKADRQDRHDVGTRAQRLRVLPLGEDSHGNCRGGSRLLRLGPITWHSSYATWRSIGWPFSWGGYYTKPAYFCTAEDSGCRAVRAARLTLCTKLCSWVSPFRVWADLQWIDIGVMRQ
jgi:hypothetical protein